MTGIIDHRSILAIDPASRGLAFAFFESGELLDWGTRKCRDTETGLLDHLFDRLKVDVLVVENPDAPGSARRPRMRRLLRSLRAHAESRGIVVMSESRHDVRRGWASRGMTTKHAVAAAIAALFPELQPIVPHKRKVYRSEEARAEIFDAISLALRAFPPVSVAGEEEQSLLDGFAA
jgi:hypothetical protein